MGVRGTLFLVWVQSSTITKVVCVDGAVNASNLMDPSQYVVLTASLAADIVSGKASSKPVLMTGEQLEELQKGLEEKTGTSGVTETTTETTEQTTVSTSVDTTTVTTSVATTTSTTTTTLPPTTTTSSSSTTTTGEPTTTTSILPGPPGPPTSTVLPEARPSSETMPIPDMLKSTQDEMLKQQKSLLKSDQPSHPAYSGRNNAQDQQQQWQKQQQQWQKQFQRELLEQMKKQQMEQQKVQEKIMREQASFIKEQK